MKRISFMVGLSQEKGIRKARMIKDYGDIVDHIAGMEEDANHDIDWNEREDEVVEMFEFFYDRYLPNIGNKHKGRAVIRKQLHSHYGRQQLVRVMKEQIEKLKNE